MSLSREEHSYKREAVAPYIQNVEYSTVEYNTHIPKHNLGNRGIQLLLQDILALQGFVLKYAALDLLRRTTNFHRRI